MGLVALIQFRRGTSSEWSNVDPILDSGEPGYETNTGKFKIGTGYTPWSQLPYFSGGIEGLLATVEELNRLHLVIPGLASPGLALVVDNSNSLDLNGGDLTVNNITIQGNLQVDNIDGGSPENLITSIKIRRGTDVQWTAENPILNDGEYGWDTTNKILKIGDGTKSWLELPPIAGANPLILAQNADILTKTTVKSGEIDFTLGGATELFTVPTGFIFSINTMEIITTNIDSPGDSPSLSFGDDIDYQAYYENYHTESNDLNYRHIIESPQNAIIEDTIVKIYVNSPSSAAVHKGYAIISGDLFKINY